MSRTTSPVVICAARPTLPMCDCTVHCGDDPELKAGRAQRCEFMRARDTKDAELTELAQLQGDLASHAAQAFAARRAHPLHLTAKRYQALAAKHRGAA